MALPETESSRVPPPPPPPPPDSRPLVVTVTERLRTFQCIKIGISTGGDAWVVCVVSRFFMEIRGWAAPGTGKPTVVILLLSSFTSSGLQTISWSCQVKYTVSFRELSSSMCWQRRQLTWFDGVPEGKFPPRAPRVVVGHEVKPLPVVRNVRKSNVQ